MDDTFKMQKKVTFGDHAVKCFDLDRQMSPIGRDGAEAEVK